VIDTAFISSYLTHDHSKTVPLPFGACNRVGWFGTANWSIPVIERMAGSDDRDAIKAAYVRYLNEVRGIPYTYSGVIQHDLEFALPLCPTQVHYDACLLASNAEFPRATHSLWLPRADVPSWDAPWRACCEAADVLSLHLYAQKAGLSPIETDADVRTALWTISRHMPGKALMPELGALWGWEHPKFPGVSTASDWLIRRQAVAGLSRHGVNITGCCTWAAIDNADRATLAAITALGESLKEPMIDQRRAEPQLPQVAPAAEVAA
jgi:hypothetical protein